MFLLTRSTAPTTVSASGSASPETGRGSGQPGASGQEIDFRFLPALTQPIVPPSPTPAAPTPKGSLAVSLNEDLRASTNGARVWVSWTGPGGTPVTSGASITTGVDGDPLRALAIASGAKRILRPAKTGHDYVYHLAVAGPAGSVTSSATAAFRVRMIDDHEAAIAYTGTWAAAGYRGYLGQSARYSASPGSAATLTFTGRSVAWIGPVGPGRGTASVQVDGANAATVSLAAAHFEPRRVLFVRSWSDSAPHLLRITVVGRQGGPVAIDSFTLLGPPERQPVEPTPEPTPTPDATLPDARLPIRAAFYYGWYPEAWQQQGRSPYSNFHARAGAYDSSDVTLLAGQIQAMRYGRIDASIASWWGPGTRTDGRMSQLLATAHGTGLAWAINDEVEEVADPDVATIAAAIGYIGEHYAKDPAYLRIGGRFVVFVGAGSDDRCALAARWTEANAHRAYLVLPAVPGYAGCADQPDQWYASDPTQADQRVGTSSYAISPGFWRPGEDAKLGRDLTRWSGSVRAMVESGAAFQLINSFNQWGDGSSVESAVEWASSSGFGGYLDALQLDGSITGAGPSGPPPTSGQPDPVLVGAGAIASCGSTNDEATAQILSTVAGTVFTVGDNAFDSGTIEEFRTCYGPSWGAFRDRTRPAAGNREYLTTDAAGYFAYFGSAAGAPGKGYYAYNLGRWRIYVLNSNCSKVGGCGVGSPQETWLRNDLRTHPKACIGAYWQAARFSSGRFVDDGRMQPFWQDLYDHGAEFVINGHDHNYQRYAPMTPAGTVDRVQGIREFIVGTGGNGHTSLGSPAARREAASDEAYGVLRMTLHASGYEWQFLATATAPFEDAGAESCH